MPLLQVHIPGVKNRAPDAVSRSPTGTRQPTGLVLRDDQPGVHSVLHLPILNIPTHLFEGVPLDFKLDGPPTRPHNNSGMITFKQVKLATGSDTVMDNLRSTITRGAPETKARWHPDIAHWFPFRAHISTQGNTLRYKDRLIVPRSLRRECLDTLHMAHQGTTQMIARAKESIFWPGINGDITRTREACKLCHRIAPSNANLPPQAIPLTDHPFQAICADYFTFKGHRYLVVVDRHSAHCGPCQQGRCAGPTIHPKRGFLDIRSP